MYRKKKSTVTVEVVMLPLLLHKRYSDSRQGQISLTFDPALGLIMQICNKKINSGGKEMKWLMHIFNNMQNSNFQLCHTEIHCTSFNSLIPFSQILGIFGFGLS